jgi:hypothetical protein
LPFGLKLKVVRAEITSFTYGGPALAKAPTLLLLALFATDFHKETFFGKISKNGP